MVTSTDTRLVPMTREQRDWAKPDVREAYDNAPADPRDVIAKALSTSKTLSTCVVEPTTDDNWTQEATAILRALSWTEEETT